LERGRAPGLAAELGALRDEALDKFMVGMHACAWASVSRPQFSCDSHWPCNPPFLLRVHAHTHPRMLLARCAVTHGSVRQLHLPRAGRSEAALCLPSSWVARRQWWPPRLRRWTCTRGCVRCWWRTTPPTARAQGARWRDGGRAASSTAMHAAPICVCVPACVCQQKGFVASRL
jgi:hypothetical protein